MPTWMVDVDTVVTVTVVADTAEDALSEALVKIDQIERGLMPMEVSLSPRVEDHGDWFAHLASSKED